MTHRAEREEPPKPSRHLSQWLLHTPEAKANLPCHRNRHLLEPGPAWTVAVCLLTLQHGSSCRGVAVARYRLPNRPAAHPVSRYRRASALLQLPVVPTDTFGTVAGFGTGIAIQVRYFRSAPAFSLERMQTFFPEDFSPTTNECAQVDRCRWVSLAFQTLTAAILARLTLSQVTGSDMTSVRIECRTCERRRFSTATWCCTNRPQYHASARHSRHRQPRDRCRQSGCRIFLPGHMSARVRSTALGVSISGYALPAPAGNRDLEAEHYRLSATGELVCAGMEPHPQAPASRYAPTAAFTAAAAADASARLPLVPPVAQVARAVTGISKESEETADDTASGRFLAISTYTLFLSTISHRHGSAQSRVPSPS